MTPEALVNWYRDHAIPLWAEHGVDRVHGGFFELLNQDLTAVERPRRARLVARQIYCFSVSQEAGWEGDAKALAMAGHSYLEKNLVRPDFTVRCSVDESGVPINNGFDLYDDAFVMFALATFLEVFGPNQRVEELGRAIGEATLARALRANGCLQDEGKALLANPHMHLAEAYLAWVEAVGDGDGFWRENVSQIMGNVQTKMITRSVNVLPEIFA